MVSASVSPFFTAPFPFAFTFTFGGRERLCQSPSLSRRRRRRQRLGRGYLGVCVGDAEMDACIIHHPSSIMPSPVTPVARLLLGQAGQCVGVRAWGQMPKGQRGGGRSLRAAVISWAQRAPSPPFVTSPILESGMSILNHVNKTQQES